MSLWLLLCEPPRSILLRCMWLLSFTEWLPWIWLLTCLGLVSGSTACSGHVRIVLPYVRLKGTPQVCLRSYILLYSCILVVLPSLYVRTLVHSSLCLTRGCLLGRLHTPFGANCVIGFSIRIHGMRCLIGVPCLSWLAVLDGLLALKAKAMPNSALDL